ncbi:MAG TPA: tetratricopeptide repeat protein [Planktothrix sp.]|jgi:tetratricopeptide (TPR) repeat protein
MKRFEASGAIVALLALSLAPSLPVSAQGIGEMGGAYGASSALQGTLNKGNVNGAVNNLYNSSGGALNKLNGAAGGQSGGSTVNSIPTSAPSHSPSRSRHRGRTIARRDDVADPFAVKIDPNGDPVIPDAHVLVKNVSVASNKLYAEAEVKRKQGKIEEAERLYMKALSMRNRVWGDKDPAVVKMYLIIGDIESHKKNSSGAEAFYHRALTAALKSYGIGSYELVPYLDKFGDCLYAQQKFVDATNEFQQVVELKNRKLGEDDKSTLQSGLKLARSYANSEKGYWPDAEDLLKKNIEYAKKKPGCEQLCMQMMQLQVDVLTKDGKKDKADAVASDLTDMKAKLGVANDSKKNEATPPGDQPAKADDKSKDKDSKPAASSSTSDKDKGVALSKSSDSGKTKTNQ